jgi:hypothetical protein
MAALAIVPCAVLVVAERRSRSARLERESADAGALAEAVA